MKRTKVFSLFFAALLAAGLACNLPGRGRPTETPTPSAELAASLEEAWKKAVDDALSTGHFTLTITEEQLTAFLATKLAEEGETPLTEAKVDLRPSEMELSGKYDFQGFAVDISVIFEVVKQEGNPPTLAIKSAELGPIPLPEDLLETFSQTFSLALSGELQSQEGFHIEEIIISDGVISISGALQ